MNQWLKSRKICASSNLVDTGWCAVRGEGAMGPESTPKPEPEGRRGGHAEELRRKRGDAAGAELDTYPTDR
ncbi:hypothetical protein GCM10010307_52700 [Streptomyces vastus]|uniref:Uncharacterized protein n=1 Tax=Streptomyces vastus TaxID=285451 RepID=A0ABN3R926_9ACTN